MMGSGSVGKKKEWEPHITKFTELYNNFNDINNIIDVGANFGYHTLLFSKLCNNVYAFEPQKQNFILLEDNIKNNKILNVILYNNAVGDENIEIKMPYYTDENKKNMGDITPNIIGSNYNIIETVTLDSIMFTSKIDIIKIDVQGWEKKVLIGCNKILQSYKPILIVEFEEFQLTKTNTTCKELFDFIIE